MNFKPIDCYYYYQDEKNAIVLLVDYNKYFVQKILNFPIDFCENDEKMKFLSNDAAKVVFNGLISSSFCIMEENFGGAKPTNKQTRKFIFANKFNQNVQKYLEYILKEQKEYAFFSEKRMKYAEIKDRHEGAIQKINPNLLSNRFKEYIPEYEVTEKERVKILANVVANEKENGYEELKKEMLKDDNYRESEEIAKEIQPAFLEFLDALNTVENVMIDEYELFTDSYKKKLDEYSDKGLFLYCQNTPDIPIDDEEITIDDVYEHFTMDNNIYLYMMFKTFIDSAVCGEINKRESDDLIASYHLLLEGKYWASLRNLYALIDHHHKLCADIFNGYEVAKKEFKNGKERSEYIDNIFNQTNIVYYEEVWKKVNQAIEEINKGTGSRFIHRNDIIHGDYDKLEVNPTERDVINIFLLYVTLRKMVDNLCNIEEAIKDFDLYSIFFEKVLQKRKNVV